MAKSDTAIGVHGTQFEGKIVRSPSSHSQHDY